MNIFFTVMAMAICTYVTYELTDGRARRHKRQVEKRHQEYLDTRNKKPGHEATKAKAT